MVAGLLFKWEDSPALSHHCGFCDRPLHHPGARASCFGTHSEPCHRFHQAMFMRLRGHTCHYCHTIDEAHHRRHKKIAEQIRDVYDNCGLADWTIIPSDGEDRAHARDYDKSLGASDETEHSLTAEEAPSSRRERKDAKCLARAAGRARVLGGDEISYVDDVIHASDGISASDGDGPNNTEEMEEIERHLKYNAHVYNGGERSDLRKFARIADVDVDFNTEIERILDAFRITELLKRNTRNRGLQGKELKAFHTLVEELKKAIVDDLVMVKKDVLEVRMRRAGYLRYTNKTAHSIVEDRYTDKDWKTGEKYAASKSDSSGIESPAEDSASSQSTHSENSPALPPATSQHKPDRRHLEKIHTRVSGDDGLGQKVIEPYHTPLLPVPSENEPRQRAVQIRVVTTKPASPLTHTGGRVQKPQQINNRAWETVVTAKKPKALSVKPAWGQTATGRSVAPPKPAVNPWGTNACEIPDFRSLSAPAVQQTTVSDSTTAKGPEGFLDAKAPSANAAAVDHPAVSQKKAKKYEREARRKAAKKNVAQEEINEKSAVQEEVDASVAIATQDIEDAPVLQPEPDGATDPSTSDVTDSSCISPPNAILIETTVETTVEVVLTEVSGKHKSEHRASPASTHSSKHMHWIKFTRYFIVDQLTNPSLPATSGCSHTPTCIFDATDEPDCPYHEPHCSCADPLRDECYLVYPGPETEMLSSGPYNRLRGEKLLATYQQNEHFKDRLMLVDDDVVNYFSLEPSARDRDAKGPQMPKRLAQEYDDFTLGYAPGPLMEQEKMFERLQHKNSVIKQNLSREMLLEYQKKVEAKGTSFMCYCHDHIPEGGPLFAQTVECAHRDCPIKYFHKACVNNLGVELVSRWFCTGCEVEMKILAHRTLRAMGYDDVPDPYAGMEGLNLNDSMDVIQKKLKLPQAALNAFRSRLKSMPGHPKVASAMAVALTTMS